MPSTGTRRKSGGTEAANDKDSLSPGTRNGSADSTPPSKDARKRLSGKRTADASQGEEVPDKKSKKELKEGQEVNGREKKEEEDQEKNGVFLAPLDEAGDLHASAAVPVVSAKAEKQEVDSDPEDAILEETRLASWATFEEGGADHDFGSWSRAIEELRRTRRPEARRGSVGVKLTVEDLLKQVRQSQQGGDIANLTAAVEPPRITDVMAVVQQLRRSEVWELFAALTARHESHPRERSQCHAWINQILEHRSEQICGRQRCRKILRPLIEAVVRRRRLASKDAEVMGCLGKWRMASGIARVRRRQEESNRLAAMASTDAAPLLEEDDEEDLDEDSEEEAAPAGIQTADADSDSDE